MAETTTAAAKLLYTVPEAAARLGVGRTTLYGPSPTERSRRSTSAA
jgi:hypothetical protein